MSGEGPGRLTSYTRDGLRFDVRDEGPLDGTPIVLLHGFPERSTCWREVAPRLHEAGLRTYAPDQRGYSPGARPKRRRDYRADELREDAVALIEQIGTPVHLVGHDWGSLVGWLVAARRPDLVLSWTAVSVPHPAAFLASFTRSDQARRSWYIAMFQVPFLPERLARERGGFFDKTLRGSGMTRDDVDRFHTEIEEYAALPGGLGWYRALPLMGSATKRSRVDVPTTLVWSDGDTALGRSGVDLTAEHVTGPYELVVLPGVSHWIPTHAPEPLTDAILARVGSV